MSILSIGSGPLTADPRPPSQAFAFVAADRRADGALRNIAIERGRVRIERRIGGIAMRIGLAVSAYRGVALSLAATGLGGTCYKISLVHRDCDLDVELHAALDDRGIVAEWQRWAVYFALPKLIEREPGRFETADVQLGALTIGPRSKPRRRGALLSKRRGRIHRRRRSPMRRMSRVLTGEREIICYE